MAAIWRVASDEVRRHCRFLNRSNAVRDQPDAPVHRQQLDGAVGHAVRWRQHQRMAGIWGIYPDSTALGQNRRISASAT